MTFIPLLILLIAGEPEWVRGPAMALEPCRVVVDRMLMQAREGRLDLLGAASLPVKGQES